MSLFLRAAISPLQCPLQHVVVDAQPTLHCPALELTRRIVAALQPYSKYPRFPCYGNSHASSVSVSLLRFFIPYTAPTQMHH